MERDYILRMIEMAGQVLQRLRQMILGGRIERGELDGELADVAGKVSLDLDLLRAVSHDTLVMLMSPGGEPEPGRTWITGELFLADGLQAEHDGDVDLARDRYERAHALFALLDPGIIARGFPEVSERLAEVEQRLSDLDLSVDRG